MSQTILDFTVESRDRSVYRSRSRSFRRGKHTKSNFKQRCQEVVLYKALEFDFIKAEQLNEAIAIFQTFSSEDYFFEICCEAEGLAEMLDLAS
jgi:hypothetical protein